MAANLPINFTIPSENIIATYSGVDIATGYGMGLYYLLGLVDKEYILTTNSSAISSSEAYKLNSYSDGSQDIDFDIVLGRAITIVAGDGYASMMIKEASNAGAHDFAMTININKVSGGSETNLATSTKTTSLLNNTFGTHVAKMTFANQTTLKKGDTLRVNIVFSSQVNTSQTDFYFDPSGILASSIPSTKSYIQIPIKIEL